METTSVSSLDYDAFQFSDNGDRLSLTGNTGTDVYCLASRGQKPRTGGVANPNPDGRDPAGFSILPGSKRASGERVLCLVGG